MKKAEKEQLVSELRSKIDGATALYFTDFTGLNVKRMTDLRRRLRKAGVEYVVIKNTLALRAVNESGLAGGKLRGPTGVVVSKDAAAAAKVLVDFAKENEQRPTLKGGLVEGEAVTEADVKKLEKEQQLGKYAGTTLIGKLGLEQSYEKELHGVDGSRQILVNAAGRSVQQQGSLGPELQEIKPLPGSDLITAIDFPTQLVAEQGLAGRRGSVVATSGLPQGQR